MTYLMPGGLVALPDEATASCSSHAEFDRPLDRTTALGPVLKRAEVIDSVIAHIFENLATQRRAPARGAIDDHRLVLGKILVVGRRLGIGPELQHAARNMHSACNLATLFHLGGVPYVNDQRVALHNHL